MRTTINLDDDVLAAAKAKVRMSGDSLGKVLSSWARKGLQYSSIARTKPSGIPHFEVGENAPLIPSDRASEILDDEA